MGSRERVLVRRQLHIFREEVRERVGVGSLGLLRRVLGERVSFDSAHAEMVSDKILKILVGQACRSLVLFHVLRGQHVTVAPDAG